MVVITDDVDYILIAGVVGCQYPCHWATNQWTYQHKGRRLFQH